MQTDLKVSEKYVPIIEDMEGVTIKLRYQTEGHKTSLQLTTHTTQIRHAFWAPDEAHTPLIRVIRDHLHAHRPTIQSDQALPESLRTL